jgi:hypothetical protein
VATSEQQQRRADVRTEGMLIGRDWTGAASDATFEDRDPATGAVLAVGPEQVGSLL